MKEQSGRPQYQLSAMTPVSKTVMIHQVLICIAERRAIIYPAIFSDHILLLDLNAECFPSEHVLKAIKTQRYSDFENRETEISCKEVLINIERKINPTERQNCHGKVATHHGEQQLART
jgi:hypothetical protein